MRLTLDHANFWMAKRGPSWARAAIKGGNVDALINAQLPRPKKPSLDVTNTVSLVASVRKGVRRFPSWPYDRPEYASVRAYVAYLASSPHSNARRRNTCRRWLKRMP